MPRTHSIHAGQAGYVVLLLVLAGCSGDVDHNDALARVNATNLQRLANLYTSFQTKNEWRGPADEATFKGFLRTYNPEKLKRIGVDPNATDALFTSERDNQPFRIRYGVQGSAMGSSEPVIFESAGVDGKRQVGFLNMTQREVDATEYETLWAGKFQPTDAPRER